MHALPSLTLNPLLIWFALIVGAFTLDDFGIWGRIVGTIMIAVVFWGWKLWIAAGWIIPCSTATGHPTRPSQVAPMNLEPEPAPRWYRRRYNLSPSQIHVFSGIGGVVVGCIVAICLNEVNPNSLLLWGGWIGVLGVMGPAMIQLQDTRHPHHEAFEACVDHTFRFAFVALFAAGVWQKLSAGIVLMLTGFLYCAVFFMMGAVWSLVLLGQTAFRSLPRRA